MEKNNKKNQLIHFNESNIKDMIFEIRGEKVMLDRDLANLYQVKTKRLNEQVRRNNDKFLGYSFKLLDNEKDELVAKCDRFQTLKHSSINPTVFSEHGVLMAANILNSKIATKISRLIIDVFVSIRKQVLSNPSYEILAEKIKRIESEVDTLKMHQTVEDNIVFNKFNDMSSQINQMSDILNEFQNSHIVIKKPEDGIGEG